MGVSVGWGVNVAVAVGIGVGVGAGRHAERHKIATSKRILAHFPMTRSSALS